MKVYLDNAATTAMDPEVFDAMVPYMKDYYGNPSSSHSFGRKCKSGIETSRRTIAQALNCSTSEICFTSGGTEADNLAIKASVCDLGCKTVITSKIEHSAVLKTCEKLEAAGEIKLHFVNLLPNGHIDLVHLEELLSNGEKTLVSLMHANNEIANVLPLKEVGEICAKYDAVFHSDTVQTMGHYTFDLNEINIHFLTCGAHKFHGPKGVGFLYVNKVLQINALITGGGQERQLRGGTENLYGIVGLGKAIEVAYRDLDSHMAHVKSMKARMMNQLKADIPGIRFNGDCANEDSLYTVLNVNFPPTPNASMLLFLLDLEGIACSGGSACSSGASKGSHVLNELGINDGKRASLRFSFCKKTTEEEIDYTCRIVKDLCSVPQETLELVTQG